VKLIWSREEDMQHDYFRRSPMQLSPASTKPATHRMHIRIRSVDQPYLNPSIIKDGRTCAGPGLVQEAGDAQFGYACRTCSSSTRCATTVPSALARLTNQNACT